VVVVVVVYMGKSGKRDFNYFSAVFDEIWYWYLKKSEV
jgi:hypothetical protein